MTGIISGFTVLMFIGAGLLVSAGLGWVVAALRSIKGGKAAALILSAMFVGFVAGAFAGVLNYAEIKSGETKVRKGWNLKPVVVAAVDIKANDAVTFDVISQRSMPEQFVTSAMVTPERVTEIVNRRARFEVHAGDPLLWGFTCP